MRYLLFFCAWLSSNLLHSQHIQNLTLADSSISFRGLSVYDNFTFWISGTNGTIGYSPNGGNFIKWVNPKGYEDRDFRDIAALNAKTAVAVAIGSPGVILKTSDYGNTWVEVYRDENPAVFLDAIDFRIENPNEGIAIGDTVDGLPYVLKTSDAGSTWKKVSPENLPSLTPADVFFAASGTNVMLLQNESFIAVSGGSQSNFMVNKIPAIRESLPKSNSETAGANGLDYLVSENFGLVVGGDFEKPNQLDNNLFIFSFAEGQGVVLKTPTTPPNGYRSGVAILDKNSAIVCGMNGVDFSDDGGENWKSISGTPFHTVSKARNGKKVYLAGPNGNVGVLVE